MVRQNSPATDGFGKFFEKWYFAIDDKVRLRMIRLLVTGI